MIVVDTDVLIEIFEKEIRVTFEKNVTCFSVRW